jgi:plastocyanin
VPYYGLLKDRIPERNAMSRMVDTAGGPGSPVGGETDGPRLDGFGWRRLQIAAAVGAVAAFLIPMVITLSFEPFLVAMLAPFVIGLVTMLRWPRVGAIWLGVTSLAVLLFSAPFLVEALTHPEAMADFLPLVVFTLSTLAGTVAAIPSFRAPRPDAPAAPARAIAVVTAALILGAVVLSVVAFVGIESVPARTGDLRVVTKEVAFRPTEITAEGSTISLHVTNRDGTRHTFTVDELGVDLNVPPGSGQRITFEAEPGTYRFYCRPHAPGMEGELVVG